MLAPSSCKRLKQAGDEKSSIHEHLIRPPVSEESQTVKQEELDESANDEDDDDIICIKEEASPLNHFPELSSSGVDQLRVGTTTAIDPYESSEIIPGLFSEIPSFVSNENHLGFGINWEQELDLRPRCQIGSFTDDACGAHPQVGNSNGGLAKTGKYKLWLALITDFCKDLGNLW